MTTATAPTLQSYVSHWKRTTIALTVITFIHLLLQPLVNGALESSGIDMRLLEFNVLYHILVPIVVLGVAYFASFSIVPKLGTSSKEKYILLGITALFQLIKIVVLIHFLQALVIVLTVLPLLLSVNAPENNGILLWPVVYLVVKSLLLVTALLFLHNLSNTTVEQSRLKEGNPLLPLQQRVLKSVPFYLFVGFGLGLIYMFQDNSLDSILKAFVGFEKSSLVHIGWTWFGGFFLVVSYLVATVVIPLANQKKSWAVFTLWGFGLVSLLFAIVGLKTVLVDFYKPLLYNLNGIQNLKPGADKFSEVILLAVYGSAVLLYNALVLKGIVHFFSSAIETGRIMVLSKFTRELSKLHFPTTLFSFEKEGEGAQTLATKTDA